MTKISPKKAKQTLGINILRAIDLANMLRKIGGYEEIDDLVPGIPADSSECVLAASFNCNCYVSGPDSHIEKYISENIEFSEKIKGSGSWFAFFYEEKYAKALAGELNEEVIASKEIMLVKETPVYAVLLPRDVGTIAHKFDTGQLDEYIKPPESF